MILAPFCVYDPDLKASFIEIELAESVDLRKYETHDGSDRYSGNHENYLATKAKKSFFIVPFEDDEDEPKPVVKLSEEERKQDEIRFWNEKRFRDLKYAPHPSRSRSYIMHLGYRSVPHVPATRQIDWTFVQMLRKITDVSRQIRSEFSREFWKRTWIDCASRDLTRHLFYARSCKIVQQP